MENFTTEELRLLRNALNSHVTFAESKQRQYLERNADLDEVIEKSKSLENKIEQILEK